jgi:hypothetical protein
MRAPMRAATAARDEGGAGQRLTASENAAP